MNNRIDLKPEYQKQIIEICEKTFENGFHVEIIVFGSRVNGNARISSDIDLATRTLFNAGSFGNLFLICVNLINLWTNSLSGI